MSGRRVLPVPEGLDGQRVDAVLARVFGLSRTAAAHLVEVGDAWVDGAPVSKSDRVSTGALLEVDLPPPRVVPIAETPVAGLVIRYEDDDVVVVDKPVGVAAHPSPGWDGPTVVGALRAGGHRVATSGADERQGVVHRLDVGTSGLMVVAKTEWAYSSLKRQFRERTVDKCYAALAQGHPDPLRGTIDAPIDRHPSHPHRFAVVAGGKPSVTHYETVEAFRAASLLDIRLETGRTHQIRVHLSAVHHPCVGDITYGADSALAASMGLHRQWLHAAGLTFEHPDDGRRVELTSSYPADLAAALEWVRAAT